MRRILVWLAATCFRFGEWATRKAGGGTGPVPGYVVGRNYFQPRRAGDKLVRLALDRYVVLPRETMLRPELRLEVIRDLVFPNHNGRLARPYAGGSIGRLNGPAQAFVDELARLAREERAAMVRLEVAMEAGWFRTMETFDARGE
jgi:hypothetical protein